MKTTDVIELLFWAVLLSFALSGLVGCAEVKSYVRDRAYEPDEKKHPEATATLSKTWGWAEGIHHKGISFSLDNIDEFAQFRLDLSKSNSYKVKTSAKDFKVPKGLKVNDVDLGGLKLGNISAVTKRVEYLAVPSITIPFYKYTFNPKWRKQFQVKYFLRGGFGYAIYTFVDSTTYQVQVLNPEGKPEKLTIPFTDTSSDDFIAGVISTGFNIGLFHASSTALLYQRGQQINVAIGATW